MRLLIDSMIAVMLICIIVGTVAYRNASDRQVRDRQAVREGLSAFNEQVEFHSAIWQSEQQGAGLYPPQVQPQWFADGAPRNPLLPKEHPWLDIAPADDYSDQPPDPLATDPDQAAFWYNPNTGVVRARVPRQVSERLTLELYNQVNGLSLTKLPYDGDPDRVPLAFNDNTVTTGQHASPARRTVREVQAQDPVAKTQAPPAQTPWWKKPAPSVKPDPQPAQTDPPNDRPSLLSP
jgi:hypothetical protein